jgi:uncharacterized protein
MEGAVLQDDPGYSTVTPHSAVSDEHADSGERTYALFNHLVGLVSLFDVFGVMSIVGTLIMWQVRKHDSPFLDDHGREALNFQLSITLFAFLGIATLGIVTLAAYILRIVGCIKAATAANKGEFYRYPCCIRFISTPPEASDGTLRA